ncbi:MAG: hypothetical protein ACWA5T_09905 [Parvularcula sp.]
MKTPWHLWVVGIVAILWNSGGAYDYLMTVTQNKEYLSHFSAEQVAYYTSMPTLMVVFWAVAIWSSVLASLLLLLRRKWAVPVFLLSIACMAISFVWGWFFSDMPASTSAQWLMVVVIWAAALFLLWYSRAMAARGVLS